MREKGVPVREKIVLGKADLLSVCEAVIDGRCLTTHNGIDSRWIIGTIRTHLPESPVPERWRPL
jgi:hypothetical protein